MPIPETPQAYIVTLNTADGENLDMFHDDECEGLTLLLEEILNQDALDQMAIKTTGGEIVYVIRRTAEEQRAWEEKLADA